MAYITAVEVRAIRNALKEAFPNLRFSVAKEHNSSVHVTIKSGDVDFSDILNGRDYTDVNIYHLQNYGAHVELFDKILDIVKKAPSTVEGGREWFDKSDTMTDYFNIAYYIHLAVGHWQKPYVKK